MITLPWLEEAKRHVGVAEVPGKEHSPIIAGWLQGLRAWWLDDETPWCGVFVAHCFRTAGLELPKHWYRAKGWLEWGAVLSPLPVVGCVVVFERQGGGHVGIVVGRDQEGRLMVLGGNQGNKVTVAPFDQVRVVGYRWPPGVLPPVPAPLPVIKSSGGVSTNEA